MTHGVAERLETVSRVLARVDRRTAFLERIALSSADRLAALQQAWERGKRVALAACGVAVVLSGIALGVGWRS